jgi:predicted nucleic acid-binding Zn finger protein
MKEDILEQLIDGYFLRKPSTFTKHNIKYRPDLNFISKGQKNKYSVHSDIDIISINTFSKETNVVSCKSWQGGFDIKFYFNQLSNPNNHTNIHSGKEVWKSFREITNPIWAKAFRDKVFEETNSKKFNYYIAVTKLLNQQVKDDFCNCKNFLNLLSNDGEFEVKIDFLTFENIFTEIQNSEMSTTIESTEIGRILQLFKSAGLKI